MRLSRHEARTSSTNSGRMLESVAYVLSTMMEREEPCTKGIAVMFNMKDFGMSNFATDYWFQLMTLLQGQKIPVLVNMLLIVNAPDWFGTSIWNIMKPMLSADFAKRVRMIYESQLSDHLADGFEQYLPNEMSSGQVCTDELVNDFCEYRKAVEAAQGHVYSSSENNNNSNTAPHRPKDSRANSSTRRFDLLALQPKMMSETTSTTDCSLGVTSVRNGGLSRSVSYISIASDCIKSFSSSHSNRRSGMLQRGASHKSMPKSTCTGTAVVANSPRSIKHQQQNQPRNRPPQAPNKRGSMLLSPPSMRRQASCHSLTAESAGGALYSPRTSMLLAAPNTKRSSRNLLIQQDKLGMPTLDTSFTSITSDITEQSYV
jgi:CRAL/TRIO domain